MEECRELASSSLIHVQHILKVSSMMADGDTDVPGLLVAVRENTLTKDELKQLRMEILDL